MTAADSVTGRSPEGWAVAVAAAAKTHDTIEIVAEANQGGKMVKAVLHTADPGLQVRMVTARLGKTERAERSKPARSASIAISGSWRRSSSA